MARHYQTVYRYWLVDEFQDTNGAQYGLLRRMSGEDFRRVFAVADDDQTIYEWNGANVRRIGTLVEDFDCEVMQLPTNYRCPPGIVEAANRLVVYNARRARAKRPAEPTQRRRSLHDQPMRCLVFETDQGEAAGIAAEIAGLDIAERDRTLVLARTRALLESMRDALQAENVNAMILNRRDDFASPEMRWLVACLNQLNRPLDRRNLATLVEAFGSFVPACAASAASGTAPLDFDDLLSRSAAEGVTYLSVWTGAAQAAGLPSPAAEIVDLIAGLAARQLKLASAIDEILGHFESDEPDDDLKDDLSAWRRLSGEIRTAVGPTSLDRFLQELELRSKEPVPAPGAVSLATIHSAKGPEFDTVYLIGLAEEILPSWHSVTHENGSAALEEERRGCFVAITRTKERLILSRAQQYRGWPKQPSRFLAEMGFAADDFRRRLGRRGRFQTTDDRRLIEDYLPLDVLNAISSKEKKHPKHALALIHYWPARRPTTACRAAIYAALAPAPRTEAERAEAASFVAKLAAYKPDSTTVSEALQRIKELHGAQPPKVLDMFAGGGAIPLEAGRLGARTVPCRRPGCAASVPLVRQSWLRRKGGAIAAVPKIENGGRLCWDIVSGSSAKAVSQQTEQTGSGEAVCRGVARLGAGRLGRRSRPERTDSVNSMAGVL